MRPLFFWTLIVSCVMALGAAPVPPAPGQQGLLFYLSGEKQFTADVAAGGDPVPSIERNVQVLPNGAKGSYFQCAGTQVMAYWAPGNIYAQRGTLSFFWRAREAVGPTAFPVFRVAYADNSSWDMAWLRIDYNGHGFDAFVTDDSLARTRVSVPLDPFPKPDEWIHLALAWDETRGIRFYINGKLAASNETTAVFNTGLDQFGPHSRIISPHQVQSDYNFIRGGDLDELRIYDRMLTDQDVATLAKGDAPTLAALPPRDLSDPRYRDEWALRYGWNRADDVPPYYAGAAISVRKVEISDAYDLKRWWWKATDGIRETTWPGVYNRSRLPGRNDYFQLPDWDCYVDSGKAITFIMPDEPWNHLEISGAAWGKMELLKASAANDGPADSVLFKRGKGQEKTIHTLATPIKGQKIRFTNDAQEEPIGELVAYNVTQGREPAGSSKLTYRLSANTAPNPALNQMNTFIHGRFPADERATLVAVPDGASPASPPAAASGTASLPLVHILIPDNWDNLTDGLDGIAIDLPALNVKPTHGQLFPLNIQVKDPLWLYRDMLDFTFSVKPGEAKTLWLDLRDRMLPPGRGMYLTIAGAGSDFTAASLAGAQVRLIFKPRAAASAEHELDRFTQAKDCYAMLVEEHPNSDRLNMWVRFAGDLNDLLRVNPNNKLGREYAAVAMNGQRAAQTLPQPPEGVPLWAFRQVEFLDRAKRFIGYYIDHRQVDFGDFGGGLSDDTDLTNDWPGVAMMGADPDKVASSLHRELEACFNNGMFTKGLPTIQADELHSYEEGINCLGQNLILDYGNPRQIERAMVTARGIDWITGINPAGHRLFRSAYYNGNKMAEDGPWGYTKPYSYLVLQPEELLVEFNGNPAAKKTLVELADGMLAHRKVDSSGRGSLPQAIHWIDDQEGPSSRATFTPVAALFWTAWKSTGDRKYLDPLADNNYQGINANYQEELNLRGAAAAPARGGRGARGAAGPAGATDKRQLETLYTNAVESYDAAEYINTEGSLWIDRVNLPTSFSDLQRARLGGVALIRNSLLPGQVASWHFKAPASDQSLGILIPDATPTGFKVIAYNLETTPVVATMTAWNIDPGMWDITQGVDANNDDVADEGAIASRTIKFERTSELELTFPPRATTVLTFKLKTPGTPYWKRPDLGISKEDIVRNGNSIAVTVHSIGATDAPAATLKLLDKTGKTLATAPIAALAAPVDLLPKTAAVTLSIPAGAALDDASVVIDSGNTEEITQRNNRVGL
ncbi:MAG TPA: LamG domain-containing protein [Phycisphaerae bacterium]